MHELEALWIFLVEIDSCNSAVEDLSPELTEVGASFVPYPRLGKQAAAQSRLEDTDGEVDIFAESHL